MIAMATKTVALLPGHSMELSFSRFLNNNGWDQLVAHFRYGLLNLFIIFR